MRRSELATVWTLCTMLALSLLSSGYLILVSQPRVAELTDLTKHSRMAFTSMLDQQSGLRGWLATGDDVFLEPYAQGRRDWDTASAQLLDTTVSPEITHDTLTILLAQQKWETWAERATSRAVTDADRTSGRLSAFMLQGNELFDTYREAQTEGTELIAAERDKATANEQRALVAVLVSTMSLLAVAAVSALKRGRRLRRTIAEPLDRLLATIGELRSGDLSARSNRSGVAELDAMGAALGELATDLQQAATDASAREARLTLLAGRFETVVKVSRETSASLSAHYVSETVTSSAAELLGAPTTLWVRGDDGEFLAIRRSVDAHGVIPPSTLTAPTVVETVAAEARPADDGQLRAYPLVLAGRVVAVLESTMLRIDEDVELVLDALLSTAAAALEAARMHSSLQEQADVDALTKLPNRRRLASDMQAEWARCSRYGRPMSFVMIDLDHFKRLNDEHGHLVGDTVLHEVASTIAGVLRASDTPYRYGGEEIAVLLRETGIDEALVVGERLRAAVARVAIADSPVTVTASVGVASVTTGMTHHSELIAAADAAMYEAKRSGRDRVAKPPPAPTLPVAG
jgi:diguanylate cyclase (GGDEF)-like protein